MESPKMSGDEEKHWCGTADHYYNKAKNLQKELDEFTDASSQIEKELESQLEQSEKSVRELRQQNQRIERENEFIKKKMDRTQQENTQLENEVKSMRTEKENRISYIRELEQKNDDLERAQRVISESVAGIETLLNQAYERNAVLEGEVDDMETLRVKLQRVSDEARDLKQELHVREIVPNGNTTTSTPVPKIADDSSRKLFNGHSLDSNRLHVETETQTNLGSALKCDLSMNGNTMTPSSRISALNIVGDLLRKVGLERFLCPDCSKVRCICIKTEKNASPQHTIDRAHALDQTPNARLPSAPSARLRETSNSLSTSLDSKLDVKQDSSPHPAKFSQWLSGVFPNNNSNNLNTSQTSNTCNAKACLNHSNVIDNNVELRKNASVVSNSKRFSPPVQKDKTGSLFSRGGSFRRSSAPPRPPLRSPTKIRPTQL